MFPDSQGFFKDISDVFVKVLENLWSIFFLLALFIYF